MSSPAILDVCRAATARIAAGDPIGAAALIDVWLDRSPNDPNLLYVAGNCALARGERDVAHRHYERAVAAAPTFVAALANLGFILRTSQRIEEARTVLRRAVTIDPRDATAWANLASCYVNEAEPEAGEAVAREALARHPADPIIRWNLALMLLEQGKWPEGWREYRHRFETPMVTRPPWTRGLRKLDNPDDMTAGDTVICHGEQGLGDEILFSGLLAEFLAHATRRGAEVVLSPNQRLASLFARNFSVPHYDPACSGGPGCHADWYLPIGDLPAIYRTSDRDFPRRRGFLSVDPAAVGRIRQSLARDARGRPLVGIAWRGGSTYTHALHRTIPLPMWRPLLEQDARFVSLAYHDATEEIERLRETANVHLAELPELTHAHAYERTCEVVAALDLVITVPTSVHHVAGAVGTPCWLVMDERAAWRECSRDGSIPWYPLTHRRFVRPRDAVDWGETIATVAAACRVEKCRK